MERFARIVLGFHGAKAGAAARHAKKLLVGDIGIEQWKPSENEYDWLGNGIYFWEHSPERARRWAGADGVVVGAVIQLGECLDCTDIRYTTILALLYSQLEAKYRSQGMSLPQNKGRELKLHNLDCLVINQLADEQPTIQTVRGAFEEGKEAFPGSALKAETHIQIAVRDRGCILGVFRPVELAQGEA